MSSEAILMLICMNLPICQLQVGNFLLMITLPNHNQRLDSIAHKAVYHYVWLYYINIVGDQKSHHKWYLHFFYICLTSIQWPRRLLKCHHDRSRGQQAMMIIVDIDVYRRNTGLLLLTNAGPVINQTNTEFGRRKTKMRLCQEQR